eukprot:CAMPEP_0172480324 /NCGR_PEP_ID=MMETSP1066-20121228/5414_1 /TAXON_ID=671091 /ORGANISM="Coscinodiscus wailesii, Strain CCMP2513" /LENGTH=798 /DNA_ID=CAMNT_0013241529 /DNA_START=68 /DNA_END=2464 /DNA_ORIENTATION=+
MATPRSYRPGYSFNSSMASSESSAPSSSSIRPTRQQSNSESSANIRHESLVMALKRVNVTENGKPRAFRSASPDDYDPFTCPHYPKTDVETEFLRQCLTEHFVFEMSSDDEMKDLIGAMQQETFADGAVIIKQGEVGDYFYVVYSGEVMIMSDGNVCGEVTKGGSFGELALLYDCPRSATCEAMGEVVVYKLDQVTFRNIVVGHVKSEAAGVLDVLKKVPVLEGLDGAALRRIADALVPVSFLEGKRVVQKGDEGRVFYIVQKGRLRVHDIGHGDSEYQDKTISAGDFFGEISLLTGEVRTANVTAVTDCSVLCLSRDDFQNAFGCLKEMMKTVIRKRALHSIPIFANSKIGEQEISILADSFVTLKFQKGKFLEKVGQPNKNQGIFIIESGSVRVIAEDGNITHLYEGDHFGGQALKNDAETKSLRSVEIFEDAACSVLSRAVIENVVGSVKGLGKSQSFSNSRASLRELEVSDFSHLSYFAPLGQGAFGKVSLVKNDVTGVMYALKAISKRNILDSKQVKAIYRERNIMMSMYHPLVIKAISCYQDAHNIYMILDHVPGGELFDIIYDRRRGTQGLAPEVAKFMSACVFEALAHVHSHYIVFRDLKPENILVDQNGYCILIDFGFAKVVIEKTFTMCGTPEYLAPELLLSRGYDKSVDIWGMGVLIYELLAGATPFKTRTTSEMQMFRRIVRAVYNLPNVGPVGNKFTEDVKGLLANLLTRSPFNRIGCLKEGMDDIRNHPYYKNDIIHDDLNQKLIEAPWKPDIKPKAKRDGDFKGDQSGIFTDAEQAEFIEFGS